MRAGRKAPAVLAPALLAAGVLGLGLGGCTIVHDEPQGKGGAGSGPVGPAPFDPAAYVDGLWAAKVIPFLDGKAVDLAELLPALDADRDAAGQRYGHRADAEGSPWSFAVRGHGKVVSTDTTSRAGTMVVEVKAGREARLVTLQIGPVVRGSAVRDCLPFFSFGDVKNQIEFAQVGRAMNDRAVAAVQPAVAGLSAPGTAVAFTGATSLTGGDELLVTPTSLARAAGGAK